MRIAVVELPSLSDAAAPALGDCRDRAARLGADAVLLNEMPFGPWLAAAPKADAKAGAAAVELHDRALAALARDWRGTMVLGSAPVAASGGLYNEAFTLQHGQRQGRHAKSRLPQEAGWYERSWFVPGKASPQVFEIGGVRRAFLLCSELMYTELARSCLAERVDVILTPRATGGDVDRWITAAKMAAMWTGAYVLSSNRATPDGPFNGAGFAVDPTARVIGVTGPDAPVLAVDIDVAATAIARSDYPCSMELPDITAAAPSPKVPA